MKSTSNNSIVLAPSLLAGQQGALIDSLKLAECDGSNWIHLDIMDGHFVPNISFGASTVKNLKEHSSAFFDVHLMLSNPDKHVESFIHAGADSITLHVEPDYPIIETLTQIKNSGCKTGIAIKPETEIHIVEPYFDICDLILIMTVEPGFGGQAFIPKSLDKINALSQLRSAKNYNFRIEVDGGINLENAVHCVQAGADTLVCGTSFFKAKDTIQFAQAIRSLGENA